MDHDQVWKELLQLNFREFLELFFSDVADRLDFSSVQLLERELFTDIPVGLHREPDFLARVTTKDGESELILIHVEIQAYRETNVPYRMWQYYSLLRQRHDLRVFPLVIYLSPGAGGLTKESYSEELFGYEILYFKYFVVGLPDLIADEYLEKDNVLAPALSALMHSERIDKVTRKLRSYDRLAMAGLDDARCSLLINVVESYMKLSEEEEMEFQKRLMQNEPEEVVTLITKWEERGIEKGIKQGISEGISQGISQGISTGILRGKQEDILRLIRRKFDGLPEKMVADIERIDNLDKLENLFDIVFDAKTLEEIDYEALH